VPSPTKKRSSSPVGAFSLSTSTHSAANLQVRQIQNGVRTFTSLLSLSFSPIFIVIPHSRSAGRDLALFWGSSMLCPGRHSRVSLVCPHRASCFRPKPPTLDTLTNNERHRPTASGSKNTVASHISTTSSLASMRSTVSSTPSPKSSAPVVSQPLAFFPVLPSTSALPEFVASYKLSSVLAGRSLRRTLGSHGTRRPGLLHPQNLPCACDGLARVLRVSGGNAVRGLLIGYIR